MTEDLTTATPESSAGNTTANVQQTKGGSQTTPAIPEGYVPIERLNGALQKIEQLTLSKKTVEDLLAVANTRIGELQAHGKSIETEWSGKVGDAANALKGATDERDALKKENASLKAEQLKVKLIGDLGHYNLLAIADQIPVLDDPAKQKEAIERMAAFANSIAQSREQELTAGTTKVTTQTVPQNASDPTTSAAWSKYIESFPFGTPEREAAFNRWGEWAAKQKPQRA
jgi:hypothetical protein